MGKIIINNYEEFSQLEGKEIGVSDYVKITQEQVNQFADATLDHQWIHTDPERARNESPFKATIAHGYLTLSLLPHLWQQIIEVNNIKLMINYGIEKLKFNEPVLVGSEVRLKAEMTSVTNLRGIIKTEIKATLEIKDCPKNAFQATVLFLYHFK